MANDARAADRVWRERGLRDAVLAGDGEAWRTLHDESFDALYAYVLWRCGGLRDPTDDIVQQAWLTAVRRIADFDPMRASFAQWLSGIASHLLRNHWRKQKRRQQVERNGCLAATEPASERDRQDQAEAVARALAGLPEHYEAVLRAKYLDGLSVNDIATLWEETP